MKQFIFLFFSLCLIGTTTQAQELRIGGNVGYTIANFFEYDLLEGENSSFSQEKETLRYNQSISITYSTPKAWLFSVEWGHFNPTALVAARLDSNAVNYSDLYGDSFSHQQISIQLGKKVQLGQSNFYITPFIGSGLEITKEQAYTFEDLPPRINNRSILLTFLDSKTTKGIYPNIQLGSSVAFQHKSHEFSIRLLGNIGIRYHTTYNFKINLEGDLFYPTVRTKSDFIAIQAGYRYILNLKKQ